MGKHQSLIPVHVEALFRVIDRARSNFKKRQDKIRLTRLTHYREKVQAEIDAKNASIWRRFRKKIPPYTMEQALADYEAATPYEWWEPTELDMMKRSIEGIAGSWWERVEDIESGRTLDTYEMGNHIYVDSAVFAFITEWAGRDTSDP